MKSWCHSHVKEQEKNTENENVLSGRGGPPWLAVAFCFFVRNKKSSEWSSEEGSSSKAAQHHFSPLSAESHSHIDIERLLQCNSSRDCLQLRN